MIDIVLIAILAGVTYFVANEGPWGAAFTLFSVILSGIIATNFFEPLAEKMGGAMGYEWQARVDIIAFLGIFSLLVYLMRLGTDHLMPTYVEVQPLLWDVGRWALGAATGYAMVAILLTSLHLAPLSREFAGFTPERGNFLNTAPDRMWLGFMQYLSEKSFASGTGQIFDYADETMAGTPPGWQFASFPIRYAHRREAYTSYGPLTPGGAAPAAGPAPAAVPAAPAAPGPSPSPGPASPSPNPGNSRPKAGGF